MGFFNVESSHIKAVKEALAPHYQRGLDASNDIINILKDKDVQPGFDVLMAEHVHHDVQADPAFWARLVHENRTYENLLHDDIRYTQAYRDADVACSMREVLNDALPPPEFDEITLYFDAPHIEQEPELNPVIQSVDNSFSYDTQSNTASYRDKQIATMQGKIETFDVMATSFRMQGQMAQSLWAEEQRDAVTHYLGEHYPESQAWITDRQTQTVSQADVMAYTQGQQRQEQFNTLIQGDDATLLAHLADNPSDYRFLVEDAHRYFDLDFNADVAVVAPAAVAYMHQDVREDVVFERKVADRMAAPLRDCEDIDVIAQAVACNPMVFDRLDIAQQQDPYLVANCIKQCERDGVHACDMPVYLCQNEHEREAFANLLDSVCYGSYEQQKQCLDAMREPEPIHTYDRDR